MKAHLQLVAAHVKLQEKCIEQQEKQMEALFTQLTSTLQLPSPVFTMTNFKWHKNDKAQWFSPPFYSHIGGYKMCISVDAAVAGPVSLHLPAVDPAPPYTTHCPTLVGPSEREAYTLGTQVTECCH